MMLPSESSPTERESNFGDLPRLSTTLLEFASPLIELFDAADVPHRLQTVLTVASELWNAGAPVADPDLDWSEAVEDIRSRAEAEGRSVIDAMLARRRAEFGHDPRLADVPEVYAPDGRAGDVRVRVATLDSAPLRAYLADTARPDRLAGLHPAFAAFVREHGFDHRFIRTAAPCAPEARGTWNRRRIHVGWQRLECDWEAPPLSELFRGDARPPSEFEMARYPERYVPLFAAFDTGLLLAAAASRRDPLDREVREVFAALRRRPDGACTVPGMDFAFDVIWQQIAHVLACQPFSAAEYEAAARQLERSVRCHRTDPVSREYIAFVRGSFSGVSAT